MASAGNGPAAIVRDANWLAQRFDFERDRYEFVRLPRQAHRDLAALNHRVVPANLDRRSVDRRDARALPLDAAPVHFIFHSGLACSTLIANALDVEGAAMALKEPEILTDVVRYALGGAGRSDVRQALRDAMRLVARPFGPNEAVIVKSDSLANALAPLLLEDLPQSRALCLYAPLPVFLRSLARRGLEGRMWGRRLFVGLGNAGMINIGLSERELRGQTDLQVAAIAWLALHRIFLVLTRQVGDRVRALESEAFTMRPAPALAAIGRHFGLALDDARTGEIVEGPTFRRHAKTGATFDLCQRDRELREASAVHAEELGHVADWAGKVAAAIGLPLQLPHQLRTD